MTNLSDTLAALDKRRAYYWQERQRLADQGAGIGYIHAAENKSNEALKELERRLMDAYRTGQLVPVPSVEMLARAMAEQANDYEGRELQWQCWIDSAEAAIAAMKENING